MRIEEVGGRRGEREKGKQQREEKRRKRQGKDLE